MSVLMLKKEKFLALLDRMVRENPQLGPYCLLFILLVEVQRLSGKIV